MKYTFSFDTLKARLQSAANFAAKKADALTGLAKANVAIYQEEDKIKKAESELGRLYYADFIAGAEVSGEAYQEICDRISASKLLIEGMKAELADLKAKDQGEAAVEEDEITDEDFVIVEEAPAEEAPAEEAAAEEAPAEAEEPAAEEAPAEEKE